MATFYFVEIRHIPAPAMAAVLSAAAGFGVISPIPAGWAADRWGATPVYRLVLVLRAVGYASYVFVDSVPSYAVLTCLLRAADRASIPLLQTIVAETQGEAERVPTLAFIRAVRNAALTTGFLVAAWVETLRSEGAFAFLFVVNGASYVVMIVGLSWVGDSAPRGQDHPQARPAPTETVIGADPRSQPETRPPLRNPRFLALTIASGLLELHDSVLFVLLPLWVVRNAHLDASVGPMLLAVNTVLTTTLQLVLGRFRLQTRPLLRGTLITLIVACGSFALAEHMTPPLAIAAAVAGAVLLTFGENLHSVAAWELSFRFAPPALRAQYLSTFGMGSTLQLLVGPPIVIFLVLQGGAFGWTGLAAAFGGCTAVLSSAAPNNPTKRKARR